MGIVHRRAPTTACVHAALLHCCRQTEPSGAFGPTVGILGFEGTTILGNTVYRNESDGVYSAGGGIVHRNTLFANGAGAGGGVGLVNAGLSTYRENTIVANATAGVTGTGINRGDNYCAGTGVVSAFCP